MNNYNGLQLVEVRAGLTNYSHAPAIRNPTFDFQSNLIDNVLVANREGRSNKTEIDELALYSTGLSASATGLASIRGGWDETNKGLMFLKFKITENVLSDDYLCVIGYITGNSSSEGLTMDAEFTPCTSWTSNTTVTSGISDFGDIRTNTVIGGKVDYLLNDRSYDQFSKLSTIRPGDLLDRGTELVSTELMDEFMNEEGIVADINTSIPCRSSISHTGVVPSRRDNTSAFRYGVEVLSAGANLHLNGLLEAGVNNDNTYSTSIVDSTQTQWSNVAISSLRKEPTLTRDLFFSTITEIMGGGGSYRGFSSLRISDLVHLFPDFDDCLDVTLMTDDSVNTVYDYRETTPEFGTSSPAEFLSQEISFSLLELMISSGLSVISLAGSNCDSISEYGDNSNIKIISNSESASLIDNDYQLANRTIKVINALRDTVMSKLNGFNLNHMTPMRFEIHAELFGRASVKVAIIDDYNMDKEMVERIFPTYAPSPYNPVFTQNANAEINALNMYENFKQYFGDSQ